MPKKTEPRGIVMPRASLEISVRSRGNFRNAVKTRAIARMAAEQMEGLRDSLKKQPAANSRR
jgi:hypothetical protein